MGSKGGEFADADGYKIADGVADGIANGNANEEEEGMRLRMGVWMRMRSGDVVVVGDGDADGIAKRDANVGEDANEEWKDLWNMVVTWDGDADRVANEKWEGLRMQMGMS